MRNTSKRRRLARKIAGRAKIVEQLYREGSSLDLDFYVRGIGMFVTEARVASARTFVSVVPVSEEAYRDSVIKESVKKMACAHLPRQIEDDLVNNRYIVGPKRDRYLPA